MIRVESVVGEGFDCMHNDCEESAATSINRGDLIICPKHARELAESLMKITSGETDAARNLSKKE